MTNIFLLLRLTPIAVLLFLISKFSLIPAIDVKCSRNSSKAAVCQVTESRLFLKQQRNFYPISASYDASYHSSSKSGSYTSYKMILLDASAQQLRVGESSRDKASIEATVAEASAFLAAKSPSYEWRDDPGTMRWLVVALMGLMLVATVRNFRQALTSSTEKRDAAQA
jgi:hypothetical protein